jgi:hypothetical protein
MIFTIAISISWYVSLTIGGVLTGLSESSTTLVVSFFSDQIIFTMKLSISVRRLKLKTYNDTSMWI